jgi:hypothetical protein
MTTSVNRWSEVGREQTREAFLTGLSMDGCQKCPPSSFQSSSLRTFPKSLKLTTHMTVSDRHAFYAALSTACIWLNVFREE